MRVFLDREVRNERRVRCTYRLLSARVEDLMIQSDISFVA